MTTPAEDNKGLSCRFFKKPNLAKTIAAKLQTTDTKLLVKARYHFSIDIGPKV